jgi:cell division protein YceG involved in septum cleavage
MKKNLLYFSIVILLIIVGFTIWKFFLQYSLEQLNKENSRVVTTQIGSQFNSNLFFALYLGTIPLLHFISTKLAKLKSINQHFISIGIIIGCGILFWHYRIFQLNNISQKQSDVNIENGIKMQLDFDNLNFERYLFFGFLIGGILSSLIFRKRAKIEME